MPDRKDRKAQPRIRLVDGQWYAFGGRGPRHTVNTHLYVAIGFCRKMNAQRAKDAPHA